MAGELILRAAAGHIESLDWTSPAAGKRGDLVEVGDVYGYLLDDVAANGRVAVGIEGHVTVPQPATARAWKAGELVHLTHEREFAGATPVARARIGYVHQDTPASETRVPVVWRPGPGHYYQRLDHLTTPAFALDPPIRPSTKETIGHTPPGEILKTLCTTTTKGIAPGVPIEVNYEGDIKIEQNQEVNIEFGLGYVLWHDDAQKKATIWRRSQRNGAKNRGAGIGMDSFSNQSILEIGTVIPNDRTTDPANPVLTTVTAEDFENGIPVQILLRIHLYQRNNVQRRYGSADGDDKISTVENLHLDHGALVTRQRGPVL